MVPEDEEDEAQVEASLDELIAKKADRPTPVDEDEDEVLLALSRDEARESLTTNVLPVQQHESVCKSCLLVLLPTCWATLELIRAHFPIGGFPWGLLGVSQHHGRPLLPLARVVGVYGLSAVLVAVNLALARALRALGRGFAAQRQPHSA